MTYRKERYKHAVWTDYRLMAKKIHLESIKGHFHQCLYWGDGTFSCQVLNHPTHHALRSYLSQRKEEQLKNTCSACQAAVERGAVNHRLCQWDIKDIGGKA